MSMSTPGPAAFCNTPIPSRANGQGLDRLYRRDAQTVAGQYNNITLEVTPGKVTVTLNGKLVETLTNAGFTSTIRQVTITSDAATGTKGSIHIDNVQIGTVIAGKAKDPSPADTATNTAAIPC